MKVSGRTRPRTPYTQEYIDRLGFVPGMEDVEERLTRLELAPRGIRREQSVIDVDIVAGGPQGPPGPPGSPFPHLIISPTHTDTSGVPFAGAVMTYNGATWTPAALPAASAGSAIFGSDYIIDAAYTGTAGATATTVNGHTVRLYATIDAALAHAVAEAGAGHFSFYIAGGAYNEQVSRTPVANETWDIHGAGSGAVRWTATGASQTLLNLGSFGGRVRMKDIGFYLGSGASCRAISGSTGILDLESVHIDTGASTSIGITCTSNAHLGVQNLTCDGSGTGILANTPLQKLTCDGSYFNCGTGIDAIGNRIQIIGGTFDCSTRDILIETTAELVVTGSAFNKGILISGSGINNCDISTNQFRLGSGETGIDFTSLSANSGGFTVTSNTFKGSGTAAGIRLDAQMISGLVAVNTFVGFTAGNEIIGAGGASLDVFHNISDAGVIADQGSPVGHSSSSVSAHNLLDGGTAHSDTMLDGASRGSLIVGVSGSGGVPLWDELIAGSVGKVLRIGNALGDPAWLDLFSIAQYTFAPDVGPGVDVTAVDQQGSIYHSGPVDETATLLYCDAETAAGTSVTVTIQYGDTNDLDTVASWTTIATKAMVGMSDSQSTMTNAAIPASRLIRFNVTSISGSAPRDMTVTLEVRRPIAAV